MITEEEKIIICSLMAAAASLESAAAGLRLMAAKPESDAIRNSYLRAAAACDRNAAKHRKQAETVLDGREMPVRAVPGGPADDQDLDSTED